MTEHNIFEPGKPLLVVVFFATVVIWAALLTAPYDAVHELALFVAPAFNLAVFSILPSAFVSRAFEASARLQIISDIGAIFFGAAAMVFLIIGGPVLGFFSTLLTIPQEGWSGIAFVSLLKGIGLLGGFTMSVFGNLAIGSIVKGLMLSSVGSEFRLLRSLKFSWPNAKHGKLVIAFLLQILASLIAGLMLYYVFGVGA